MNGTPRHHQILPPHYPPATSAHDFISLVGCRPRVYVNLLADYRDDSGVHSYDGILGNEERGLARLLERPGNPDRRAGYLVLHARIEGDCRSGADRSRQAVCIHMIRRALQLKNSSELLAPRTSQKQKERPESRSFKN